MKLNPLAVAGGVALAAAAGVALLATKTAGPVQLTKYTELRTGPLQEHLVSVDELNMSRTFLGPIWPMRYPGQVAAGITTAIVKGFAPLYTPADPQAAALPAEQAW